MVGLPLNPEECLKLSKKDLALDESAMAYSHRSTDTLLFIKFKVYDCQKKFMLEALFPIDESVAHV